MKTTSIILAALVFGIFSVLPVNASSRKEKRNIETTQATKALRTMFKQVPNDENLMGNNTEEKITVNFRINGQNELTNLNVQGSNDKIVKQAYETISKNASTLGLNKGAYEVTLRFVVWK
jgi:hypothetical protein